jgi:hypothetical protein
MQIGGGPYSVVSESPVCSRSTSPRMLAEAVEHTVTLDESYCSAGIFVRSQVQQVTPDAASSVNSSNDSHPNPPRCLAFCNRRPPHVRSTVSFALGIDGRGLSKEFLWRADNKGWGLATSARHRHDGRGVPGGRDQARSTVDRRSLRRSGGPRG